MRVRYLVDTDKACWVACHYPTYRKECVMSILDSVSGIYATNAPGFVYPFPSDAETARMKNIVCGHLDDHIYAKYSKQIAQVQGLRDLAVGTVMSKWENDSDDLRQMTPCELAVLIFDYHFSQSDVIYY